MEKRGQFTFYRSFYNSIKDLPDEVQHHVLMAVLRYALDGIPPEGLEMYENSIFLLIQPNLDSSAKKAANGRLAKGKPKAKAKQNESKGEKEKETEIEKEVETEIENELETEIEIEDACKAVYMDGAVVVGNIEFAMGTGDTGEPFGVSFGDGMIAIFTLYGSASQTVGITHKVYHPLERAYLPKMCHVVTIPTDATVGNPSAGRAAGTAHITDSGNEILHALVNNLPVYLDLTQYRNGFPARVLVQSWNSVWEMSSIQKAIDEGAAQPIPVFLHGEESANHVSWTVYVNATD